MRNVYSGKLFCHEIFTLQEHSSNNKRSDWFCRKKIQIIFLISQRIKPIWTVHLSELAFFCRNKKVRCIQFADKWMYFCMLTFPIQMTCRTSSRGNYSLLRIIDPLEKKTKKVKIITKNGLRKSKEGRTRIDNTRINIAIKYFSL